MVSHSAIAYRDDSAGAQIQSIAFDDDRWRGYVPIPPPWTATIRDGLPRGCAAVLLNRAHTFADLVLPVTAFEVAVLDAIDGSRTLTEIFRSTTSGDAGARLALDFVQRLWWYDQIVFDASRST